MSNWNFQFYIIRDLKQFPGCFALLVRFLGCVNKGDVPFRLGQPKCFLRLNIIGFFLFVYCQPLHFNICFIQKGKVEGYFKKCDTKTDGHWLLFILMEQKIDHSGQSYKRLKLPQNLPFCEGFWSSEHLVGDIFLHFSLLVSEIKWWQKVFNVKIVFWCLKCNLTLQTSFL